MDETQTQVATAEPAPERERAVEDVHAKLDELAPAERERTGQRMFAFSSWVHVGPGAEDCDGVDEEKGEVECGNPLHFHAWCRLPNQFQHREIREKATAAKARKARQLRDQDSGAYAVLEDEIDSLRRLGEGAAKPAIVQELVQRDWWQDYLEAVKDVNEFEDDGGAKIYEHILRDRQRYQELQDMPADERPKDEFDELVKHLAAYEKAINDTQKELQRPRREAFEARDFEDLLGVVRDQRIDIEATEEFQHIYSTWQWYLGTHRAKPPASTLGVLRFASVEEMQAAAPEVIEALQAVFQDLERTFQQGKVPGNS